MNKQKSCYKRQGDPRINENTDPCNSLLYLYEFDSFSSQGRTYLRCHQGMSVKDSMVEDENSPIVPLLVDAKNPDLAHPIGASSDDASLNTEEEDYYIASHSTITYKKIF